jgi:hypothetical protein
MIMDYNPVHLAVVMWLLWAGFILSLVLACSLVVYLMRFLIFVAVMMLLAIQDWWNRNYYDDWHGP